MAKQRHKLIPLKKSNPLAMRLKSGTIVRMSDGWRGRVHRDDGDAVSLIRDGGHKLIPLKKSNPLAMRLKSGTIVRMSDGWRGRVHRDDGDAVSLIRDGEQM